MQSGSSGSSRKKLTMTQKAVIDVRFTRPPTGGYAEIRTSNAIAFLTELAVQFEPRRRELLAKRAERWEELRRARLRIPA
jgi:malate synthase